MADLLPAVDFGTGEPGKTALEVTSATPQPPAVRKFIARCLICNVQIECPPDVEEWSWTTSDDVARFKAEHASHAGACGIEIINPEAPPGEKA